MLPERSATDSFTEFFKMAEVKLRLALTPSLGVDAARDATAEALTYAWEHWERIGQMENPVGYLYKVGRDRGRRMRRRKVVLTEIPRSEIPHVEPGLPEALARLSERQRTVVMLIHCFQWTLTEVADLLDVSKSSVQTHVERGMKSLRRELGGET